ncbi:MAG: hypothetical protein FWE25_02825 [Lachnospiraceae bacterium]|nr:hypothetical protein [Lachnospiraceae bacterium]
MKHIKAKIYLVVITITLLIPLLGLLFLPRADMATDHELHMELAPPPQWEIDGVFNYNFLYDAGSYFEDQYFLRPQLITLNSIMRRNVIRASGVENVIQGASDWLFFADTLDDYFGEHLFSEREIFAVAHNLKMMQDYVEARGGRFLVVVAPNKNTVYASYMPFYLLKGAESNLTNLNRHLDEMGVSYVDLIPVLQGNERQVYFQRDTHWNAWGAMLADRAIHTYFGIPHVDFERVSYTTAENHSGDLEEMVHPSAFGLRPDRDYYFDPAIFTYSYVTALENHMDPWIETHNPAGQGTMLMFRDSFGINLIPFTANALERGYFSRLVPYNLSQVDFYQPDFVVVQRAERQMATFAVSAAIMQPPMVQIAAGELVETDTTITVRREGDWLNIFGRVDGDFMSLDTAIYVTVSGETMGEMTFPAFYLLTQTGDGDGYQVYLQMNMMLDETVIVSVTVEQDGVFQRVVQYTYIVEDASS